MTKILMDEATVKLALEALEYIANETYDPWTNGAEAGRIAQTTLSKIKNKCRAIQTSDQMTCECGNVWDMNDPYPPKCTALREAPAGNVKETQKIEHEPAQQEPLFKPLIDIHPGLVEELKAMNAPAQDSGLTNRYTAPQPAQHVTDEQVEAALKAACMHSTPESRKDMRRAIEAAHGIKENT